MQKGSDKQVVAAVSHRPPNNYEQEYFCPWCGKRLDYITKGNLKQWVGLNFELICVNKKCSAGDNKYWDKDGIWGHFYHRERVSK